MRRVIFFIAAILTWHFSSKNVNWGQYFPYFATEKIAEIKKLPEKTNSFVDITRWLGGK